METLSARWKGLSSLPRIALAELPTPVEGLEACSAATGAEIWCKRDDQTALPYGGNKVRKLEWLLGDARSRGVDRLITTGAFGSHHVLATAIYGIRHGFEVDAVLYPQALATHVEENLRADLAAGATLHPARTYAGVAGRMIALATRARLKGGRPLIIGPGGSSPVGCIGYVEAGVELARQIDAGECPEPRRVFVAAGSGGTVVGLAVGLAAAGLTSEVVGVRVAHAVAINRPRLRRLAHKCVRILREADDRFPDVASLAMQHLVIDGSRMGGGYGVPTPEGEEAIGRAAEDGVSLEPTYTAKTFAALLAEATTAPGEGPLLYVHTLSSADMGPLIDGAPPTPSWAR